MNPLYLTEGDVVATFTMRDALALVEDAARALAEGGAQNKPRQRAYTSSSVIQVLVAAYGGRMGHKTYTVAPKGRGAKFWYTLFDENGEMLAIIEADALGQIRTGAASGVATRYMAREDARTLAVIGTGWQARTQLEACAHVRPIERVRVYGRDPQRRADFCELMSERVDVPVEPVASGRDAVAEADVVCTMTNSNTPVLEGAWLKAGAHVNAAGSNRANAQEIDVEAVARAAVVAVEDLAQAKIESGDLRAANESGRWQWEHATRLSDVVAGHALGRTSDDQITLFESLGIGLWDVAAASHVFDRCVIEGRGTRLPIPS
ncbi:MAG: ornithine cyclodeaminase family protein [Candidatus Eremiobacteraeota bacterium]|nr:ornithine cyclodeaminase family protein [Candidatus Eremiobacteraeota bacterium]